MAAKQAADTGRIDPKWQGDFTLPRLRAKLAGISRLHPSVEQDYQEVYNHELGGSTMLRRVGGSQTNLRDLIDNFDLTQANLGASKGLKTMKSMGSSTQLGGLDASRRLGGSGSAASLKELPASVRMHRVISVPSLGTRRAVCAPASLQRIPADLRAPGATRSQPTLQLAQAPPTNETLDLKAIEKEKQIEIASRRFWNAAHGNMHFLQEELEQMLREAEAGGETLTGAQLIARMKVTQVCNQMNAERKKGGKVDYQHKDWDGATLLIRSVRCNQQALMYHLLGVGADPLAVDNAGRGCLHWAAIEGNGEVTEFWLKTYPDTDINVLDAGGDAALHLAAYHGHLPIIKLLLQHGADINEPSQSGFTAYQLAEARRMWHVTRYLAEFREMEEDKANKDSMILMHLLRPCNLSRAKEYRIQTSDQPKPKAAAAGAKKK